jgi:uncharacterized protein
MSLESGRPPAGAGTCWGRYNAPTLLPMVRSIVAGMRRRWRVWALALTACAAVALPFWISPRSTESNAGGTFLLETSEAEPVLAADGRSQLALRILSTDGRALPRNGVDVAVVSGARSLRVVSRQVDGRSGEVAVRATIVPGSALVRVAAPRWENAELPVTVAPSYNDRVQDGTPDALRLDDAADREAFRGWFTYLAEAQYFRAPESLPVEISDCSALLRFAYREALREHSGSWAAGLQLEQVPRFRNVQKYVYPYTPLAAALFRVKPGAFSAADLERGAFAEFADAATLRRLNTHFVSRDLRRAQPGDLLFFHQYGADQPHHSMIWVGTSHLEPQDATHVVVYHTGPHGKWKGEIRRLTVSELLEHPQPQWRPLTGNSNFLGIYRWNILREAY